MRTATRGPALPGIDRLALHALDPQHQRAGRPAVLLLLHGGEGRPRDGEVGRQGGCPRDGPVGASGRGSGVRGREIHDDGPLRRIRGCAGEDGGVVVAEDVVNARMDGCIGGRVGQERQDRLERRGRRRCRLGGGLV